MHLRFYKLTARALRKAKQLAEGKLEEATIDNVTDYLCQEFKADAPSFNEKAFRNLIEKGE